MNNLTVELCMGSSCFARGNAKALGFLESYIEKHNLAERIDITGHLCLGTCSGGPNIKIGGTLHQNVNPDSVVSLVQEALKNLETSNG
ncbi:NAD(P)H-dependent oxidoreductase subunit E [Pleomorphochaeta sp. DL1XJH-081]|jgi:NADH:ubiquinone oxidoreductase subunit E|uniref:NAD(P)H-dependent oxidoreductase subunit E n=1 Tax=Pleomorphochaeta sp. DL1XJH-081 TaxID=3409690 RepID=UPI003BB6E938